MRLTVHTRLCNLPGLLVCRRGSAGVLLDAASRHGLSAKVPLKLTSMNFEFMAGIGGGGVVGGGGGLVGQEMGFNPRPGAVQSGGASTSRNSHAEPGVHRQRRPPNTL